MKEYEAFLRQARSDFELFKLLWANSLPSCHAMHQLQMATEKLAKAIKLISERQFDKYSHAVFADIPDIRSRQDIAAALGQTDFKKFKLFLRRSRQIFLDIQALHPNVSPSQSIGGSNTEYPWQARDLAGNETWLAPADHEFEIASKLKSGDGLNVINLVEGLLTRFDEIFV